MKKSKCGGMACAFNTSKIHQEDCEHFLKGFCERAKWVKQVNKFDSMLNAHKKRGKKNGK